MSEMLKNKRATRGLRMEELVGEAAEQDDAFWGHDTWADGEEESGAESFSEEEVKPDVFDSDFNDTESSEDEDEDEEAERGIRQKERQANKRGGKYKEPVIARKKAKAAAVEQTPGGPASATGSSSSEAQQEALKTPNSALRTPALRRSQSGVSIGSTSSADRTVRGSTKAKTEKAEIERAQVEKAAQKARIARGPRKVEERHIYTQRELLEDALETELVNQIWLDRQKIGHDDVNVTDKSSGARTGPAGYIRKISKRGAYDTITFSTMDVMPKVLMQGANDQRNGKTKTKCVITGRIAKYRDPLTNKPYATLAAFKEIRRMAANRAQAQAIPLATTSSSSGGQVPVNTVVPTSNNNSSSSNATNSSVTKSSSSNTNISSSSSISSSNIAAAVPVSTFPHTVSDSTLPPASSMDIA